MKHPQVVAIIPAGGRGSRMGEELPKQYLPLGGKPLLCHTLTCFENSPLVAGIILVVRSEDMDYCRGQVLGEQTFGKLRWLVPGGRERHESVYCGLRATGAEDEIVVVHDAVRPFVSQELLEQVIEAAVVHGAAVAGVGVAETIKEVQNGHVIQTLERSRLWSIQTPQAFRRSLLLEAHQNRPEDLKATDDAMLVEYLGHEVRVVAGDSYNLKITTPEDLVRAEWLLRREEGNEMKAQRMRVGQGVDVHALVEGRKLILGGVHIPFDRGLAGHSDADVLTHAIVDALLGAAGCGDIGRLFPDTDVHYKNIFSLILLEQVRDLLIDRGAKIHNIDAVVMAQKPRLAPHIPTMTDTLARSLRLAPDCVSLKATTTEGLGFAGREEGIMAQAVALLEI